MKKILAFALALAMVLSMAGTVLAENKLEAIKAAGKIVLATSPDFAPSEFMDPSKDGQEAIVGSDISLAKYIADYIGVELVIEPMDFSAVLGAVSMGAADLGISGFSLTEERQQAMELSEPYLMNATLDGQGILVLTKNADLYKTAADFKGKKIAAQNGSLQYELLIEQLPEATVELVNATSDAMLMLLSGKVDAISIEGSNGIAYAKNYEQVTMSEFYYSYEDAGYVVAAAKGQTELIAAVNEALAKAKAEGLLVTWYQEAVELSNSLGLNN